MPPTTAETRYVHLFPDRLDVTGTLEPEVRQRGIFKVVLYNARLAVTGQFPALDAASLGIPAGALRPDEAFLQIGIPDMAGLRDGVRVNWGGTVARRRPRHRNDRRFRLGRQRAGPPHARRHAVRLPPQPQRQRLPRRAARRQDDDGPR